MLRRTGTLASASYAVHRPVRRRQRRRRTTSSTSATTSGDDPAAVRRTAGGWPATLGLDAGPPGLAQQVHGAARARRRGRPRGRAARCRTPTAWSPGPPGLGLVVLVADCVPVLLAARRSDVVAAAHAGRRGVEPASSRPRSRRCPRSVPGRTGSWPSSARRCAAAATRCRRRWPTRWSPPSRRPGRRAAPARRRWTCGPAWSPSWSAAGVRTIEADPWCTAESPDLYSYRRDGVTGRFAGVVLA